MRLAGDYLRTQLASQHPQRMRKMLEFPLLFGGDARRDPLHRAAAGPRGPGRHVVLPARAVAGAGQARDRARARAHDSRPRRARDADVRRSRALGARRRHQGAQDLLLGRDNGATLDMAPTWRDRWDDTQLLPMLIRVEVTPRQGPPWPPLVVAPRAAPEAGCRAWDTDPHAVRGRMTMRAAHSLTQACLPRARRAPARHRAHHRALAHDHAHGDRERLRVLDAQRSDVGAQRAVARAGARGRRMAPSSAWRSSCRGPRYPTAWASDGQPRTWREGDVDDRRHRGRRVGEASTSTRRPKRCSRDCSSTSAAPIPTATAQASSTRSWTGAIRTTSSGPNGAEEADYRAAGLQAEARQRAVRDGQRARARDGHDAGDLRAHRRQPHRAFAPARHQCGDRVARRAARAAQRHAASRRRLPAAARRRAGGEAAGAAVPAGVAASPPARCRCGASAPRRRRPMV